MTVKSTRRGFLEAIGAFTAAVAAGVKMPPAASGMPALPVQEAVEPLLEDWIKNSACILVEVNYAADGLRLVRLHFVTKTPAGGNRMVPTAPTVLNAGAERLSRGLRVVSLVREKKGERYYDSVQRKWHRALGNEEVIVELA